MELRILSVDDASNLNKDLIGFFDLRDAFIGAIGKVIKDRLLCLNLSIPRLRGHNYDGVRNMLGKNSIAPRQIASTQIKSNENHLNGHKMLFSQFYKQFCFSKQNQKKPITIETINTLGSTSCFT